MAYFYAGQYGPETILDQTSKEAASASVTVYESNGSTLASLYTDQTMATASANPVTTDTLGNLAFFATPGVYILSFSIGGVATTRTVQVQPWYADLTGQGCVAKATLSNQVVAVSGSQTQVNTLTSVIAQNGMTISSSAITVPTNGIYRISGSIVWDNSNAGVPPGYYQLAYQIGSAGQIILDITPNAGTYFVGNAGTDVAEITAGQAVTFWIYQDSGAPQGILGGGVNCNFSVERIGN